MEDETKLSTASHKESSELDLYSMDCVSADPGSPPKSPSVPSTDPSILSLRRSHRKRKIRINSSCSEEEEELLEEDNDDDDNHLDEGHPVTEEDRLAGWRIFLQEEERKLHDAPEDVEVTSQLQFQWNTLPVSEQMHYIKRAAKRSKQAGGHTKGGSVGRKRGKVDPPAATQRQRRHSKGGGSSQKPSSCADPLYEIQRLILSPSEYRAQPVCHICEATGTSPNDVKQCTGPCQAWFHPECQPLDSGGGAAELSKPGGNNPFQCLSCRAGRRLCALCVPPQGDAQPTEDHPTLVQCQIAHCHRTFHSHCWKQLASMLIPNLSASLQDHPPTASLLTTCPAHFCWSCHVEESQDSPPVPEEMPDHKSSNTTSQSGQLVRCVKCPMSYHAGDLCVPAGSVELSLSQIICPRHLQKELLQDKSHRLVHPAFCFVCYTPNCDVFCDQCPKAFHAACIQPGHYRSPTCADCLRGKSIRYGQCVWAKVGNYRWWPCEVIHPRNAPLNILKLQHKEGAFPVHFLGGDEYQWVSQSRVFPYEYGRSMPLSHRAVGESNAGKQMKMFNAGLAVVGYVHQLYVNLAGSRVSIVSMSADPLPGCEEALLASEQKANEQLQQDTYTHNFDFISENQFSADVLIDEKIVSSHCECTCLESEFACCTANACANARQRVVCHPDLCPAGVYCRNQHFRTHSSWDLDVFTTSNRGWGLRSKQFITAGSFVLEYVGQVISMKEANRRIKVAQKSSQRDLYLVKLDADRVVDADRKGNFSRFLNHSCSPNLQLQLWRVDQQPRLGLFALRDIGPLEELTFRYDWSTFVHMDPVLCFCGADQCVGYVNSSAAVGGSGVVPGAEDLTAAPPTPPPSGDGSVPVEVTLDVPLISLPPPLTPSTAAIAVPAMLEKPVKEKKYKVGVNRAASMMPAPPPAVPVKCLSRDAVLELFTFHNKTGRKQYEDLCYRCGDGGELILCDKQSCPKTYHLHCVGLARPPTGIWYCPWHVCCECGRPAVGLCSRCPNSYCAEHVTENCIYQDQHDLSLLCGDHGIALVE